MKQNLRHSKLVLLGAGGHAKVLISLARSTGLEIVGICAPNLALSQQGSWLGVPILGDDTFIDQLDPIEIGLINGIGHTIDKSTRKTVYEYFRNKGFSFPALVHPSAHVDCERPLAQGLQIMAGAIVQPGSSIGENSIINTRASVDHDCKIGRDVHIAPGAVLCGGVEVQDDAFIGAGAIILQGRRVGQASVLGAGATLTRDLDNNRVQTADGQIKSRTMI